MVHANFLVQEEVHHDHDRLMLACLHAMGPPEPGATPLRDAIETSERAACSRTPSGQFGLRFLDTAHPPPPILSELEGWPRDAAISLLPRKSGRRFQTSGIRRSPPDQTRGSPGSTLRNRRGCMGRATACGESASTGLQARASLWRSDCRSRCKPHPPDHDADPSGAIDGSAVSSSVDLCSLGSLTVAV
jgi:hypothetical protein